MFEKRRVTVTLLDLICLFVGRIALWFGLTLLAVKVVKGLFNIVLLLFNVLDVIWPVLLFVTLLLGMVLFLMTDDKKDTKKRVKRKVKRVSPIRKDIKDLVFVDLDNI